MVRAAQVLKSKSRVLNPKSQVLNPELHALNPKPQVLKSVDLAKSEIDVIEVAIHSDIEHEQISAYMESQVRLESPCHAHSEEEWGERDAVMRPSVLNTRKSGVE